MKELDKQVCEILERISSNSNLGEDLMRAPFVISNDANVATQMPQLVENTKQWKGGYAILIGSGGLLSILPELKDLDFILVVDKDKRVLDFHEDMIHLVESSDSPIKLQQGIIALWGDRVKRLSEKIHYEGYQYGDYHWTDPKRFPVVQNVLMSHHIHFIHQDIASEELARSLQVFEAAGLSLRFANLTNVHSYLGNWGNLRRLPITSDTSVMFSKHDDMLHAGNYPVTQLVMGFDAYENCLLE